MNVRLLSTVGLVAVAGALVVAGCGSSDDSSTPQGGSPGNGGTSAGGIGNGGSAGTAHAGTSAGGGTAGGAGAGTSGGSGGATGGTGAGTGGTGAGTGGASTGGTSTGGTGGSAVAGETGEGGEAGGDSGPQSEVIYDFESGTQNWSADATVTLAQDTAQAFDGTHSLKVTVPALALSTNVSVKASVGTIVPVYGGSVVTFHLWVPAGTGDGLYIQGYSQTQNYSYFDPAGAAHNGNGAITLVRGGWSTITYTLPPTYPGGLQELGIQIGVGATGTGFAGGDFYLDSISVTGGNTSCSGAGTGTYDFETAGNVMGWVVDGSPAPTDTAISQSTDQAVTGGTGSLKVAFTALPAAANATTPTQRNIYLASPNAFCGQTLTFNVWTPAAGSENLSFVAFAQTGWYAAFPQQAPTTITRGDWTQWTFTLPNPINPLGLQRIGVQFNYKDTTTPFTGNVYIDNVSW